MRTVVSNICRGLIALAFAAALTFGVSQTVSASANGSFCDTPPNTCNNSIDCVQACLDELGTPYGGACLGNCCICIQ